MSLPHATVAQTDFSAGQIDLNLKRSDDPIVRAGARQLVNARLLNSKRPKNRPGRRAIFAQNSSGRVDQIRITNSLVVDFCFCGDGSLVIRDTAGIVISSTPPGTYPWNAGTTHYVNWTLVNFDALNRDVVICFPGMRPQIARYNAGSGWGYYPFQFLASASGGVLAPFYRIAPAGITLTASGQSGIINLVASAQVFDPGMTGTYIQYLGCQVLLGPWGGSTTIMQGTVQQQLPASKTLNSAAAGAVIGYFTPGDIVVGSSSGFKAEVVGWNPGTGTLTVNMMGSGQLFYGINGSSGPVEGDHIIGPTGSITGTNTFPLTLGAVALQPTVQWSELIMGDYRGWPQSAFFDQGRLGFTNFPAVPRAVAWTAVNQFYDLSVGAQPTNGFLELMSDTAQIFHVVPGDGGEIVFTDIGVYYIPISENNPLKPGSVVFKPISPEAASFIKPVRIAEGMLYVNAGFNRIVLVVGTGATSSVKPYSVRDLTIYHTELFNGIKGLAVTTGDGDFPERYIYSIDISGRVIVGRFDLGKDWIGWVPWAGYSVPNWISSLQSTLTLTSTISVPGAAAVTIIEQMDETAYLDSQITVNSLPASLLPPGGKGPMWWLAGGTVTLMDKGTRHMGTYQVDANGFIVPKFVGGEDMASATLVAGQPWSMTYEPIIPQNAPGQTVGQRMKRRKIARWAVSVLHSSGFVAGDTRIPAYRMGEDATLAPPLREETVTGRQQGRDFDPRFVIVKDTPGPFTLIEAGAEVTV